MMTMIMMMKRRRGIKNLTTICYNGNACTRKFFLQYRLEFRVSMRFFMVSFGSSRQRLELTLVKTTTISVMFYPIQNFSLTLTADNLTHYYVSMDGSYLLYYSLCLRAICQTLLTSPENCFFTVNCVAPVNYRHTCR